MQRLTRSGKRIESEIEEYFSQRERRVWDTIPDASQLKEGERHLYKNSDGDLYFVTQIGGSIYFSSKLATTAV